LPMWFGFFTMTLICFPIPIAALAGAVVSVCLGLLVCRRRPVVLIWVIPEALVMLALVIFVYGLFTGRFGLG
jgi:hypothetical protein